MDEEKEYALHRAQELREKLNNYRTWLDDQGKPTMSADEQLEALDEITEYVRRH